MKWIPRKAQPVIRDFILENPRCNIWADMGVGKSSSTLSAFDLLWLAGSRFHPLLVIAPKTVARDAWPEEIEKWDHFSGLRVSPILGSPKQRAAAVRRKADVYTINYENIPWLVDHVRGQKGWKWPAVVADESRALRSFRLSHGGKRAAALSKVAKMTGRWVNLTGTPAPEGVGDLWGQNWFVDFGKRLGHTHTAFIQRWFRPTEYGAEPYAHAAEEIMELLQDVTLSIEAKDWFDDYYEPILRPVYVDLPAAARKIYNEMELDLFTELDKYTSVEAMSSGSKYGKCSQLASGAIYVDEEKNWKETHKAKLVALKEVHEDHLGGDPLLVAYHFKHDLARLQAAFPDARVYASQKDGADWNAGKIPMMLVHPGRAAHGLSWQDGGCNIAFFSPPPGLERRQQIIERIGPVRQIQSGHPRPVNVWDILARDTVNEVDYARAQTKESTQNALRAYASRKKG